MVIQHLLLNKINDLIIKLEDFLPILIINFTTKKIYCKVSTLVHNPDFEYPCLLECWFGLKHSAGKYSNSVS